MRAQHRTASPANYFLRAPIVPALAKSILRLKNKRKYGVRIFKSRTA
jgi:hypothetical protein